MQVFGKAFGAAVLRVCRRHVRDLTVMDRRRSRLERCYGHEQKVDKPEDRQNQ